MNVSYRIRTLQKFALLIRLFTLKLQQAQKAKKARKTKVNPSATMELEIEKWMYKFGFLKLRHLCYL
jgi:hypothetical protein